MSFWTNIQQTLIQLVDDRQDFWQWSALILCLFGASSASFLLRTKAFRKGSPSLAIITRFFNPAKQISLIPASFCILLWITWSARIQWSKQLTVQGGQPIPSDYIFTTVGEEWGFVGTFFVIVLFMVLMLRILFTSKRQKNKFSRIYCYSVVSLIFAHFSINLGMVLGLLPTIGIPLPFLSYGGSNLLAFSLLLGIYLKLDANRVNEW